MEANTVTSIQIVFIILLIFASAIMQTISLVNVDKASKSTAITADELKKTKDLLLISIIMQFVAVAIFVGVGIYMFTKRATMTKTGTMLKIGFIAGVFVLLVGGSIGASAAINLQCSKSDTHLKSAWDMSMISALIGIMGTMLTLVVYALRKRKTITDKARDYLMYDTKKEKVLNPTVVRAIRDNNTSDVQKLQTAPATAIRNGAANMNRGDYKPTFYPSTMDK